MVVFFGFQTQGHVRTALVTGCGFWCHQLSYQKGIIVDFREKKVTHPTPIVVNGEEIETVDN